MTSLADLDIVIPTYRGAERVAACVAGLGDLDGATLWLVDDASGDDTVDRLRRDHPDARIIERAENGGFAVTADTGLRAGSAPFVALLNDDLLPRPGFLPAMLAVLRGDDRIGMVAPVMVRPDGERLEGVGIEADPTVAGFSCHWGARLDEVGRLDHSRLLGPSGGAAAYRRAALEEVGYLDLAIGSYSEDLDVALRIRAAGWAARPALDAVTVHLGSVTFGHRTDRQLGDKGHSRGYLMRKYGVLRDPRTAGLAVAGEAAILARQLTRDRSTAGLRGRVAGWRLAGRRERVSVPDGLLNGRIGFLEALRRRRSYGG
ncbi:glycosyltransferase family 2 protein [Paraconexibacter sp.]|uniref:glycosyltransferase family 2 protein n=1 Tax=Paraconexibacter sp. TaxID=2949640 RepID=UPI0035661B37